jgi:CheY-like chemotaxis protein
MNSRPILYVEDEENDAFFMERAFKELQLPQPLKLARNGQEAIDYLAGTGEFEDRTVHPRPCLMLLDLNLPLKSGFDVLEWVRQQPELHTLIVLVLSSSSQEKDIHHAYALGANAYLVKPSGADQLLETMQVLKDFWLGRSRMPPDCSAFASVERPMRFGLKTAEP